jgi:hypothetical protein
MTTKWILPIKDFVFSGWCRNEAIRRLVEAEGEEMRSTIHRERQLLQYLRAGGWVRAYSLPSTPKLIEGLLHKAWIERRGAGGELCYRITDTGKEGIRSDLFVKAGELK